jgi:type I restriction enzyme S subunit
LGSVTKIINGFPFKSDAFGTEGHPVIRIRDVTRGFTNTRFNGEAPAGFWVERGDLVVGMDGDFQTAFWRSDRALLNQRVCKILPDEARIDRRYLGYVLPGYLELINAHTPSVTVKHLSSRTLASIPLPLPPLERQRRIADRIDELFAEIDDGEAALTRARDDLATWRKALLKAAVTGELTAGWRAANPPTEIGAEFFKHILTDRASAASKRLGKRRDKAPEEVTPAQQELMWSAPDGWTWMQLGYFSFVTKLAGFEYTKYVRYDDDGDLRVIKAENAGPQGFKKTDYSRIKSSSVAELTRSRLHGGELLMVFVGAGTGNVAIVPSNEEFFLGPNIGMMRVETGTVSPRYVELFLRSPVGKALATAAMKAVAQPSLSMGTIRQIPILLPPAAEQDEILRRLEQALLAATDCVTDIRDQQTYAASLRQSILAAAFRGELA